MIKVKLFNYILSSVLILCYFTLLSFTAKQFYLSSRPFSLHVSLETVPFSILHLVPDAFNYQGKSFVCQRANCVENSRNRDDYYQCRVNLVIIIKYCILQLRFTTPWEISSQRIVLIWMQYSSLDQSPVKILRSMALTLFFNLSWKILNSLNRY